MLIELHEGWELNTIKRYQNKFGLKLIKEYNNRFYLSIDDFYTLLEKYEDNLEFCEEELQEFSMELDKGVEK